MARHESLIRIAAILIGIRIGTYLQRPENDESRNQAPLLKTVQGMTEAAG